MYLASEISAEAGDARGPGAVPVEHLERVYSFLLGRVGTRSDAEDLTQQVALKALPRLREGASEGEVRAYLFATARSVLAAFWSDRYRVATSELGDDVMDDGRGHGVSPPASASTWLEETLGALPPHYRTVLELRFLRGCSIRETAREMGRSVGAVKVMQLRALRAASVTVRRPSPTRPERRPREAARDFACGPQPAAPGV